MLKRWIVNILLIGGLIGISIYAFYLSNTHKQALSDLRSEVESVLTTVEEESVTNQNDTKKVVLEQVGLDLNRVEQDNEKLDAILQIALNWDGYDAYTDVRNQLMTGEYSACFSSDFFETFMPEIKTYEQDGELYYNIKDYGVESNMEYSGVEAIDTSVLNIDEDGTYHYLAEVDITSKVQDIAGTGKLMLTYSVSPESSEGLNDGEISDIRGYTIR